MITGYTNYQVEIRNDKFIADDGRKYPRTANVMLLDEKGDEIGNELFGDVDTDELYAMIKEGKTLNLDKCYIKDFSLSAYRRINGIEKKELVSIKGFSARNAFFDAHISTDFSYTSFQDGDNKFRWKSFRKRKSYV